MTVFKYINKKDNSLIGYHLSTLCQAGPLERAKRYECSGDKIESQKQTIQANFNSVINATEENQKGHFFNLLLIKEAYFKDLTQEDVEIQHEEVPDVNITYKVHTIVDENGVRSV